MALPGCLGMMKPVQPSTPASPTPRARSAPFSVHSRGVMLFDQHRFLDGKFIGLGIFRSLRDMSGSAFQLLMAQGWLSVWTTLITIISVFFFTYIEHGRTQYIDWSVASFMVFLPLLSTVWWTYQRREQALRDLAETKILLQHIALAHKDWLPSGALPLGHLNEAQAALHTLINGMRSYFLPPRFYSTEFPFTGLKLKMMRIAQDRAKQTRRITIAFHKLFRLSQVLQTSGLGDGHLSQLAAWSLQLQMAFERMSAIKEYRTPQGFRALARCYVTLFIPIFFGPYYANLRLGIGTPFAVIIAIVMNLATVAVLHTAMALEDPFDNQGLDGIYVDEALFEAEQAIQLTEEDLEPTSARADVSGKPGWMGTAPNNAGMRLQAGPPVPAGVGHSPSAARGPEPSVGDSVNELPSSTNGPDEAQVQRPGEMSASR
ncbi:g4909 [Coccomyxa viridis]|uniref:G4909 protein n=1 Tax=Coccomyxa viridis TaxID=1274662 RepID=A0ABP1FRH4_9CHLO